MLENKKNQPGVMYFIRYHVVFIQVFINLYIPSISVDKRYKVTRTFADFSVV